MDNWVMVPCQRSRLPMLNRLLESLEHPPDHVVVITTDPDRLCPWEIKLADHVIGFSPGIINIALWWNFGLDYIQMEAQPKHEVLAISSDCIGRDYSVAMLAVFMRQYHLTMVGPNHHTNEPKFFNMQTPRSPLDRVPGGTWMLAGESGLRVDEQFRWWYSDDDLDMQARQRTGSGTIPGTGIVAEADTPLNAEKIDWSYEDRQKFKIKWGRDPW